MQTDDIAKSAHVFSRQGRNRSVSPQKRKVGNADPYGAYEEDSDDYEKEMTRGRKKRPSLDSNASQVELDDRVLELSQYFSTVSDKASPESLPDLSTTYSTPALRTKPGALDAGNENDRLAL